jgi:hypothetical protein
MFTTKIRIFALSAVISTALTLATSAAFANAPGGAYIQCDGSKNSPVRCVPDEW